MKKVFRGGALQARAGIAWLVLAALVYFAAVTLVPASTPGKNILFIGNSFTYYNNGLHNHFNRFVRAADMEGEKKAKVRIMTISGARLSEHTPGLVPMLKRTEWDIVVLQGHSYETIPTNSRGHFRRAVRAFHKQIRDSGAETALFMTWAYEDRPEMTATIDKTYSALGESLGATVVPVGLAFERAREMLPEVKLTTSDKKHPRYAGTYLAAAVFFATLYEATPVDLDYVVFGLSDENARALREIAWETVVAYKNRDR